jgi:tetratricopeptide (TPR) repeat protein
MKRAALALVLCASTAWADTRADDHMLAGARLFQTAKYAEALVEFRVAERLGDAGAAWYVASALSKMGRAEDAVVEFGRAEAIAPTERDGLLDYYHAMACYDARLYFCADRLLSALGDESGPRIAGQARQVRTELAPLLRASPDARVVDWYHTRGAAALAAGRTGLARAYYDEAASLAALRPDRYRRTEALARLDSIQKSSQAVRSR